MTSNKDKDQDAMSDIHQQPVASTGGLGTSTNPPQQSVVSGDKDKKPVVWLNAFDDNVAGLRAYNCHVDLASLEDNGDNNLLIADMGRKLKIYQNTYLISEHVLLDVPVALCTFYMEEDGIVGTNGRRQPVVAVACEDSIFIYKNMRPFYKFTLPALPVNQEEAAAWELAMSGHLDAVKLSERLVQLKQQGLRMSPRSAEFLRIEGSVKLTEFILSRKTPIPPNRTAITCMSVLCKGKEDEKACGCLVVGTEASQVLILEPNASSIKIRFQLPAPPVMLNCNGALEVEYRVIVACRNQSFYTIKNGEISGIVIDLDVQPVGLVIANIFVGCMNNVIHAFQMRGKKSYTHYLPAAITSMELLCHQISNSKALLVALANCEVRVYSELTKALLSTVTLESPVTAMRFGKYGRENGALVLISESGSLSIKMLSRASSNLSAFSGLTVQAPESEVPLPVPKKTQLYLEQARHEQENCIPMHRTFQRDIFKLKLNTLRTYVKSLSNQQGHTSYSSGSSIRLAASVQGLGPVFKLKFSLENIGKHSLFRVPVVASFNQLMYAMPQTYWEIPVLISGLMYKFEGKISCLDERGALEPIMIYVCSGNSTVPLIAVVVEMPIAALIIMS